MLESNSVENIRNFILSPIADAVSILMRLENWLSFRDGTVINLLSETLPFTINSQSLANLAVERIRFGTKFARLDANNKVIDKGYPLVQAAYERVLSQIEDRFERERFKVTTLSIQQGYIGLLRKCLKKEALGEFMLLGEVDFSSAIFKVIDSVMDSDGNTLIHHSARLGFLDIIKTIIECLGITVGREVINRVNITGQTPLYFICKSRAPPEIFRLFWVIKATLNTQYTLGRTPLHYCFLDQNFLPEYHSELMKMIEKRDLTITISLNWARAYGIYSKGNVIDIRAFDFRKIIYQLYCRGIRA